MRPKLLEIEGLQSFREKQRIDFESLGETGLFGIFGPTGSGKSTVLDAITFALYGRVKRAERGTQGIINTNVDIAKVVFTFELLKDSKRRTFRVERTYQRKKGSENSCEPRVARLIEVMETGEIPICDKASEVSGKIEDLIGLGHDDFTRAVVLPQNSFQEFLMLDNSKKRDMLERIFYLEEYGKQLLEKLNRKITGLKSKTDVLSGELMGYADATGEALKEAQNVMEKALAERTAAETELRLLEARFNEAREVWQLVQERLLIEQREQQQTAFKEKVDEKRLLLEKAVKADGAAELIRQNRELSLKLRETEKLLKGVLDALPGIEAGLIAAQQKYEEIKSEAAAEQPRLIEQRARLLHALEINSEIKEIQGRLIKLQSITEKFKSKISDQKNRIDRETKEFDLTEQKISGLKQEMEILKTTADYRLQIQEGARLESEAETAGKNAEESVKKTGALNIAVASLEGKLNSIRKRIALSQKAWDELDSKKQKHESLKPEDRDAIQKYRDESNTLRSINNILLLRKNQIDDMDSRIVLQQSNLRTLRLKALETDQCKAGAAELFEKCRAQLEEKDREVSRNAARMLSKSLIEGEPCPVCGSKHHPNPAALMGEVALSELELQLEHAKGRLTDAENALRVAENASVAAREQVRAAEEQLGAARQEFGKKVNEFNMEKLKLPEQLRGLELADISAELDIMDAACAAKLVLTDTWEKESKEYEAGLKQLSGVLAGDRLVESGLLAELKITLENRTQAEEAQAEQIAILSAKQAKHLEFLRKFEIESANAEMKRIAENDRKIDLLQKEALQIQKSVDVKRVLLEQLKEELRLSNNDLIKADTDIGNLAGQKSEKEIKLKELAGEADADRELKRIAEKLEEYLRLEKQYREECKAIGNRHNEMAERKTALDSQRGIYSNDFRSTEEKLKAILREKGFSDIEEAEKSMLSKEIQQTLSDEILEYDREWVNIKAQKGMVLKRLDSRSITEEEWNRTSNAFQELAAFKEECVSRSEVAKNSFNSMKDKHERWLVLNKSYSELSNKYGLLDQIHKLLRAERGKDNSFIDYIAEERLRYVAAKASEALGIMTGFKYALELDTDAGFIIRDYANGGVHRMVSSLSGGETFLTSLSLALALSEQIQLKGQSPLEFFFLDEGFGTLDNNLLDAVIDSLEKLSSRERVIGLISHVPEVRSRISRRLVVDPPSAQGDGSRVRIEKA